MLILIDNAAKYDPPKALATLASTRAPASSASRLRTRGPASPKRSYQASSTASTHGQGAARNQDGVSGLPIAKTIVEAHDGRIEAKSRLGEGTSIAIYLSLLSDHEPSRVRATDNTALVERRQPRVKRVDPRKILYLGMTSKVGGSILSRSPRWPCYASAHDPRSRSRQGSPWDHKDRDPPARNSSPPGDPRPGGRIFVLHKPPV